MLEDPKFKSYNSASAVKRFRLVVPITLKHGLLVRTFRWYGLMTSIQRMLSVCRSLHASIPLRAVLFLFKFFSVLSSSCTASQLATIWWEISRLKSLIGGHVSHLSRESPACSRQRHAFISILTPFDSRVTPSAGTTVQCMTHLSSSLRDEDIRLSFS